MKHTPGPWIIFYDEGFPYAVLPAGRPGEICRCSDKNEANARLIAAAPDYHDDAYILALLVLQSDSYKDPDIRDSVDNVLAIHKRAEGRNP